MILETIFYWLGGILSISLLLAGVVVAWLWLFDRIWYNTIISVKALVWHLSGESVEKKGNTANSACELKLGSTWYTRFRNKRYEWKCVGVEAIKK